MLRDASKRIMHQCIMGWEICGGSNFALYTIYIATNCTMILFSKQRNYSHSYMLESILLSTIHIPLLPYNLALIFFVVRWGTSEGPHQLYIHCLEQVHRVRVSLFDKMGYIPPNSSVLSMYYQSSCVSLLEFTM